MSEPKYNLDNVEERAQQHPSFGIPLEESRKSLAAGDFAKVIFGGERFWLKVTRQVEDGSYFGAMGNQYIGEGGPKLHEVIPFGPENVCGIIFKKELV